VPVRYLLAAFLLFILQLSSSPAAFAGTCAGMTVGQLTSLNGFVPFPSSSLWNTDISGLSPDLNSANIINYIGSTATLHPDFGSGTYAKQTIGIPYQVVAGSQLKVNVKLGAYASESDPGPMPIPSKALIEGYPNPGNGDRHVLVLEKDGCWLYELYHAYLLKGGQWSADSTAIWDMTSDEQRPYPGPQPTPPACRSSRDWRDTMRSPPARLTMRCASPCLRRARLSRHPRRTGPPR
jgi:hypothetical protein